MIIFLHCTKQFNSNAYLTMNDQENYERSILHFPCYKLHKLKSYLLTLKGFFLCKSLFGLNNPLSLNLIRKLIYEILFTLNDFNFTHKFYNNI